ncbi:XRE family transcriptional regulator [Aggregatibacter actinomycetemcomitans]|uniref:XRE family transcriptional regulator n=2 Tax=Aggregatibacter actinomycetemcomitans TaxID=714 RepID=A0A142G185_AGGAC|nr:XRE family transcriptional regulator [Aggregatibacter actinomycetemcomitans D7S-1]AMQ94415.1 XRE family transcriptional regulator [Aggregatibacter actinomycetemcomitans]EKX97429.1 toxin-antitoxin system, antitoxin component, Xre domain protein [Aggregatibacter actinomycetemcomitans Y4]KND83015.1 XRE family transcriptional regulator [Aggregatibacter actinomycetemcomitans serotype a str. H5P1]KOE30819.1 XRE family transcriptional regulator [Aggregatibacter actinomycetemcomitans D17P-3]KOE6546
MVMLVENYETTHYLVTLPPPEIEAIKFRIEQKGLSIKDLDGIIGKPNRVYEVFNT